jgi:hypothetical protein
VLDRVFTVETDAGPQRLQIADGGGGGKKPKLWRLIAVSERDAGGLGGFRGFMNSSLRAEKTEDQNGIDAGVVRNPPNPQYPPELPPLPAQAIRHASDADYPVIVVELGGFKDGRWWILVEGDEPGLRTGVPFDELEFLAETATTSTSAA